MSVFTADVRLGIGVVVLIALTTTVLRTAKVPLGWGPAWAVARGAAQLALVGLALRGVFDAPPLVVLALGVMLGVAVRTAAGRIRTLPGATAAVALACGTAAVGTLAVIFALGMLELSARYLVALGGIVIGGTMLAASLTGRHLAAGLVSEREEIEGLLALGATPRQATARICRRAVAEAMTPVVDQTRTTGLVTLPGAFIGALLGGADPMDAARFQLVVLAALIHAQAVSGVIVAYRLGAPARLPGVGGQP
ncbi:ABC transporter permease [Kineosporia sp. J2-2]|uniref:ABC transporter permease n=1 Tax=Kineosporia corallincola TaxID=2835133 RepID=A0ABS5TMK0_9ACTN|nr:ABC transporter permease [Kineosporia corallincola]MBT0772225.1 ABC transporter permease [Kineosporia corallincola]